MIEDSILARPSADKATFNPAFKTRGEGTSIAWRRRDTYSSRGHTLMCPHQIGQTPTQYQGESDRPSKDRAFKLMVNQLSSVLLKRRPTVTKLHLKGRWERFLGPHDTDTLQYILLAQKS